MECRNCSPCFSSICRNGSTNTKSGVFRRSVRALAAFHNCLKNPVAFAIVAKERQRRLECHCSRVDKQWWAGQELFITRSEQCRHPYITCTDLHAQPWYCAIPSRAVRYEPKANGPWSIPQKNITQPTQSLLCITHPTPLIAPCNEPTTKIEKCQMLFEGQSRVKPSENSLSSATGRS